MELKDARYQTTTVRPTTIPYVIYLYLFLSDLLESQQDKVYIKAMSYRYIFIIRKKRQLLFFSCYSQQRCMMLVIAYVLAMKS